MLMYLYPIFIGLTSPQGLDLPDIEVVVQLGYVPSLCTLMQRLGRGARGRGTTAQGVYIVEPTYFHRNQNKKRRRGNSGNGELNTSRKVKVLAREGHADREGGKGPRIVGDCGSGEGSSQVSGVDISMVDASVAPCADGGGVAAVSQVVEQSTVNRDYNGVPGGLDQVPHVNSFTAGRNDPPSVDGTGGSDAISRGLEHIDPGVLSKFTRRTKINQLLTSMTLRSITETCRSWFPALSKSSLDFEESMMELFINAQDRGICRRVICDKYFSNDQAG